MKSHRIGIVAVVFIAVMMGLNTALSTTVFFIFLLASFFVGFFNETQSIVSTDLLDVFNIQCTTASQSLLKMSTKQSAGDNKTSVDKRLSGSSIIDDAVQDVFQYIIRDYVENWYSLVTKETEFLFESKHFLQKIAINASNRCKEVDWLPFLTTRFFDSVIAHIRTYREAKNRLNQKTSNEDSAKGMNQNLVATFFELERSGTKKNSRKRISMDPSYEKECLKILSDFLLQLLGKEELNCRPLNLLSSQILAGEIIIPLFDLLSDPDYINQTVIWLCKNCQITSDSFLSVIRCTENFSELDASQQLLTKEIAIMRSHDFGGEDDIFIKRKLSSLLFVNRLIGNHIRELNEGSEHNAIGYHTQSYWKEYLTSHDGNAVYQLPLDFILKNSVALSYLLDFMTVLKSQAYIFFLLNVEGWKIGANQQISQLQLEGFLVKTEYNHFKQRYNISEQNSPGQILMSLQESAMSIFSQYFADNVSTRLQIDDVVVRRLLYNLKNEAPVDTWFDEAKSAIICKIEKDERFMPSFRKSIGYIRMLAELDMLKEASKSDDEDLRSLDDQNTYESNSSGLLVDLEGKEKYRSDIAACTNDESTSVDYTLSASICQKGVVKDGISSHAVYSVTVVKSLGSKEIDSWVVYRRYSDFHDFHIRLEERFRVMKEFSFPAKRAFNNMDKLFLERRQYLLNEYLSKLLKPEFLRTNPGIKDFLLQFFDRGSYEHSKGMISRKVDSLMNPLVSSMRTVTKVVRSESSSLRESSNSEENLDSMQTSSGIPLYGDDQLPLRILLILMDEIFDLQTRNQWLRKRVFYVLREILRAMFGDVFNQKIVDYVVTATSPEQVAELIQVIKNSCWPNGVPAMPRPSRDEATKMRTRVAAKMSLLSLFSDEIKHLIGSETTREGVLRIFELLQNPILNRRLLFVIFEGVIDVLFPESNIDELFEKLYVETSH
ncbi:sorting nexin-13-like [Daphnia pulicaria]|uniref:sorting nexin-13-like n=1 Tax=Daphnia pulicaria TaxID=35523 RepID=UPI001EEAE015|nr:sorting nexin-13-like [Daphnia pulicaria]